MENSDPKVWMQSSNRTIVVKLPVNEMPPESRIGAPLRRCSSDIEMPVSRFEGFEIKRYKNKVIIKDTSSSSSSSSATTLVPKNFLRQEIDILDDIERNMESDFSGIASSSSGLSRSCTTIAIRPENNSYPVVRSSSSCCDLSQLEAKDILPKFEALREYNQACNIYKVYSSTFAVVEEYFQARYQLELSYPNYWNHLYKKLYIDLDSKTALEETECQIDFIETCKTLFDEENNKEGSVSNVELTGEIIKDFEACALYMKDKFPYLFTYLINKYDFEKFSTKKILVRKNRAEIIKLSKQPHEELTKREEKYMVM